MMHCLLKCTRLSALILLAGAVIADQAALAQRVTPEVLAARRTMSAVGNIHTEKAAPNANNVFNKSESGRKINGMGTGIIIDERGYMVTNFHVIADVDTIKVDLQDENHSKTNYVARRISSDKEHDLAIIKIDAGPSAKPFKVMPCGTSSDLEVCERVIAIGNAYGYDGTVTLGIISALGRDVEANETVSYKNLIQTDAAINPGNSGGPLINMDGEVIGINVAIRAHSQKIGFAIPIDDARKVIARMMSVENMDRNFHGLLTNDVKDGSIRMLVVNGAQPSSPAQSAGLLSGDVITKVGPYDVVDAVDLERSLLHRRAGENIEVQFRRGNRTEKTSLALTPYSGGRATVQNDIQVAPRLNEDADRFWGSLGVRLTPLPVGEHATQLSRTKYRGGMRVLDVRPDSPAAAAKILKGDILVGMQEWETTSIDNIVWIMNRLSTQPAGTDAQGLVKFFVVRNQETKFGHLSIPTASRTAALPNGTN